MSHLFLVRHGQASFLEPDYDKLSAKGESQSQLLGEYWTKHKVIYDRAYTGPKVRQKETARIVGEAYRRAGLSWPEPVVLPAFDEFQAEAVLEQTLPPLVERDEHVRTLHQAFLNAGDKDQRFKTFQRVFEAVIAKWARGELPTTGIERWPEFCDRIQLGLRTLSQNGSRGQRIAVFTSGGPVGVAMQKALGLSTQATLRSAWMVRNCAYSEFLFSSDRFTLNSYNACPHLIDPAHLTYR
ncbi:MAG TPA: phosphoglycerate mutase family protein [Candidatus Angelobacter sp.]